MIPGIFGGNQAKNSSHPLFGRGEPDEIGRLSATPQEPTPEIADGVETAGTGRRDEARRRQRRRRGWGVEASAMARSYRAAAALGREQRWWSGGEILELHWVWDWSLCRSEHHEIGGGGRGKARDGSTT